MTKPQLFKYIVQVIKLLYSVLGRFRLCKLLDECTMNWVDCVSFQIKSLHHITSKLGHLIVQTLVFINKPKSSLVLLSDIWVSHLIGHSFVEKEMSSDIFRRSSRVLYDIVKTLLFTTCLSAIIFVILIFKVVSRTVGIYNRQDTQVY